MLHTLKRYDLYFCWISASNFAYHETHVFFLRVKNNKVRLEFVVLAPPLLYSNFFLRVQIFGPPGRIYYCPAIATVFDEIKEPFRKFVSIFSN